ncbi:MAG: glycosyltransferase family 4 protein [Deltaproteobacteria bacterium]
MAHVVRIQSRICVGGPALHSILLSEGLSHRKGSRYDTTLIGGALEPGERGMEDFAESRGVQFETVPTMRRAVNPMLDAQAVVETARRLRRLKPTIVHTHTAKAGAVGRTAARLAGVPIVLHTFHGHVFEGYFSSKKAKAFVAAERALAKVSDRILAISKQQRDDLVHKYRIAPAHKVDVVPLGLDLDRFRAGHPRGAFREELGLAGDTPLVVAVGRLVPIKRFDLLLEAFARVLQDVPNAHLAIAGDGDPNDRAALERQAAPFADRVHFLGWRRDLERMYADADVLALTSDNEGTPVTVIEALSAGLPVVATRVGGVEDVLSPQDGTLVAPGDVGAIAHAIQRELEAPRRLGDEARKSVTERFSHRRLVGDIEALYDDLMAHKVGKHLLAAHATRGGAAC